MPATQASHSSRPTGIAASRQPAPLPLSVPLPLAPLTHRVVRSAVDDSGDGIGQLCSSPESTSQGCHRTAATAAAGTPAEAVCACGAALSSPGAACRQDRLRQRPSAPADSRCVTCLWTWWRRWSWCCLLWWRCRTSGPAAGGSAVPGAQSQRPAPANRLAGARAAQMALGPAVQPRAALAACCLRI